jgi:hypothetical protein
MSTPKERDALKAAADAELKRSQDLHEEGKLDESAHAWARYAAYKALNRAIAEGDAVHPEDPQGKRFFDQPAPAPKAPAAKKPSAPQQPKGEPGSAARAYDWMKNVVGNVLSPSADEGAPPPAAEPAPDPTQPGSWSGMGVPAPDAEKGPALPPPRSKDVVDLLSPALQRAPGMPPKEDKQAAILRQVRSAMQPTALDQIGSGLKWVGGTLLAVAIGIGVKKILKGR